MTKNSTSTTESPYINYKIPIPANNSERLIDLLRKLKRNHLVSAAQ